MTEFQSKLHELNSCIENAKKEKLNLMIDKYREPIRISLHSINKLLDDECFSKQEVNFKENNFIIENSIDQQRVILNKYISDMQLMLSSRKEED